MEKNGMIDVICRKEDCSGCHACFNACPVKAIEMREDEEGFWYPVIIQEKCIGCNRCKNVCPASKNVEKASLEEVYGCYAKRCEEQMESSSGAVFSVLARRFIAEQGMVCGAVFDEKLAVEHVLIHSEKDLYRLKGTKYVQSRIKDVFNQIKKTLEDGKGVLFSGTPCQVAGLKCYLGKEYEKLLCIDIICHGVPSPEVWQRYLEEKANGKHITEVTFRNKEKGISNITIDYVFSDGAVVKENYKDSLYMKGFIQNLFLRPSCFTCKYKGDNRYSDITIGDFWSVKEFYPEFDNQKGVSAVIIHTEKGRAWFQKIQSDVHTTCATIDEAACWNECLLTSTKENLNRTVFFERWKEQKIMELIELLAQETNADKKSSLLSRIKGYIRKVVK